MASPGLCRGTGAATLGRVSTDSLRWGILSTGTIAHTFARGVAASANGRLVAVGSRTRAAAGKFAAEFGGLRAYGDGAALLADPEVEAVYIATPHPQHAEWAIAAAQAGKHILCEKPLALNRRDAERVVAAARAAGVTLMEAFMYRCHPQTAKVAEIVRSGALGELAVLQGAFSFFLPFQAEHRLFARALGGGGILDVGCYPVSFCRLLAGAAGGRSFADPVEVKGTGTLHPQTGTDVWAAATLRFASGLVAQVSCGVSVEQESTLRIHGTDGRLVVESPWFATVEPGETRLWLHRRGHRAPEEIVVRSDRNLYTYEAEAFAAAVRAGQREVPALPWADTLGNLGVLDVWRTECGVVYPGETR